MMNSATEFLRALFEASIQASLLVVTLILLLRPILGRVFRLRGAPPPWVLVLVAN